MKCTVKTQATVEAPCAEAAKQQFPNATGVTYSDVEEDEEYVAESASPETATENVDVPRKLWVVSVSGPNTHRFDLVINADTEQDAKQIAIDEIQCFGESEEFGTKVGIEVQSVEPFEDEDEDEEDEDAELATPETATEVFMNTVYRSLCQLGLAHFDRLIWPTLSY